jgi:hypothetical protein
LEAHFGPLGQGLRHIGIKGGVRLALHRLQDQVVRTHVVQSADARMVQRGDGPRLAFEAPAEAFAGNLDGDADRPRRESRAR